MDFFSASLGWAVGNLGEIIKWNGTAWAIETSPVTKGLRAVTVTATDNAWTVGDVGTIVRYTGAFLPSGTFISTVMDSGTAGTLWNVASWTETLPVGTDLVVDTRTGNVAVPDGTWSSFGSEVAVGTGVAVSANPARYLQYRLTLNTTDISVKPSLEDITFTYRK